MPITDNVNTIPSSGNILLWCHFPIPFKLFHLFLWSCIDTIIKRVISMWGPLYLFFCACCNLAYVVIIFPGCYFLYCKNNIYILLSFLSLQWDSYCERLVSFSNWPRLGLQKQSPESPSLLHLAISCLRLNDTYNYSRKITLVFHFHFNYFLPSVSNLFSVLKDIFFCLFFETLIQEMLKRGALDFSDLFNYIRFAICQWNIWQNLHPQICL